VQHKASDYRMMAAMCLEIANRMSLDSDRLRLTDRAQQWLELAQKTKLSNCPKPLMADLRDRCKKAWNHEPRLMR